MIVDSRFIGAWVFLRDGKVIDLSGMLVDEAARYVTEIERLTNQGVVIVEDHHVDERGEPIITRARVRES